MPSCVVLFPVPLMRFVGSTFVVSNGRFAFPTGTRRLSCLVRSTSHVPKLLRIVVETVESIVSHWFFIAYEAKVPCPHCARTRTQKVCAFVASLKRVFS